MKKLISILVLLINVLLHATTTPEVFRKYPNKYFIETGSYEGDGIQKALSAGFREIYSIELSPHYYERASDRFKALKNVHIFYGDSSLIVTHKSHMWTPTTCLEIAYNPPKSFAIQVLRPICAL